MPPRRWTKERILGELVSRCGLPTSGTIQKASRRTALVYTDSGLRRQLAVAPDQQPGLLLWHVNVDIPDLGRPGNTADFGTRYALPREPVTPGEPVPLDGRLRQRVGNRYDWPVGNGPIDPRLIDDVRRYAASMLWFLKDRQELGRLLLAGNGDSSGSWERNGVTASRWCGAPAGVVQALILARVLGDVELEALALEKLDRERDHLIEGFGGTLPQAVGYWAEEMLDYTPVTSPTGSGPPSGRTASTGPGR